MNQILYLLDIFPLFPSLQITFHSKDSYSNHVSQLTSFLIFSLSAISFYYFGYNMIMHQNPNNVVSDIYQSDPEYLNITNKNSFFCFGLRNTNSLTNFLDETIYTAELLVNVQDKNGTKKSTSISIKACEEQDIPETQSVQDYFEENPVNNLYCIADYGPIELEGSEDNSYMKFFNINIKICQNTTENNFSCKGPDIIKSTIANSSFYLGFMAYAVDPMNYSFPFLQMGSFFSTPIDFNFQSLTTLTFQHIEIITDDGLILENSDILKGLNKLSDRTAYRMRNDANDETILQQTTILWSLITFLPKSYYIWINYFSASSRIATHEVITSKLLPI